MPMLKTVPYTERPMRIMIFLPKKDPWNLPAITRLDTARSHSSSFSRPAAVHGQGRARHETGCLRGEENDYSTEFLWSTPPAQRDVVEKELIGLWVVHYSGVQLGCERAGAERIDRNVVSSPLQRQHLR